MNKFIAVLRDSYREAVSTWVIPVMLVFSFLLVLLVASIGFRPVTLQDELNNRFGLPNALLSFNPELKGSRYDVENLVTSDPAAPWKADYEFDVVFRATPAAVKQFKGNIAFPMTARQMRNSLRQTVPFLDSLEVVDRSPPAPPAPVPGPPPPADEAGADQPAAVPSPPRQEFRFHATTRGTRIEDRTSWPHQPSFLFAWDTFFTMSLRDGVYSLEKRLTNDFGALTILLVSVIITAGFIPNLLRKGTVDLYISKPIGRVELLLYKYVGGLIFVLLLTTAMVGGIWLTVGLRTGLWAPHFLALIPLLTFYFAILYAVSTLAAVLTRSTLVAILATLFAWAVFFGIGWGYDKLRQVKKAGDDMRAKLGAPDADPDDDIPNARRGDRQPWEVPAWLDITSKVLYYPAPRTYDMDDRMIHTIARGALTDFEIKQNKLDEELPPWGETLGVSAAFIALCLALAGWRMATRDN